MYTKKMSNEISDYEMYVGNSREKWKTSVPLYLDFHSKFFNEKATIIQTDGSNFFVRLFEEIDVIHSSNIESTL